MTDLRTQVLPAQYMRLVTGEARTDTKDILVQYLVSEPGTVELTQKQQELLERATEADRLMRSGRYSRRQMELMLCKKFDYSIDTGRNDLYLAEYLWGNSVKRNKSYLLSNHIDQIDDCIRAARDAGDQKNLAVFMELRGKAIKELSDEDTANTRPAAIIFNFTMDGNSLFDGAPMTGEAAKKAAADFLGKDEEEIEFEEI